MEVDILQYLRTSITTFDSDAAVAWTHKAMDAQVDPIEVLGVVTASMKEIGDGYTSGELWLPDLVGAAGVVQMVMPIIEEYILKTGATKQFLGMVVIGTVCGDMHTIGKGMVASLLIAAGYEVDDLGIDIPTDAFVEAVSTHHPKILAMSALLSVTAAETKRVIDALAEAGLRDNVKIMVGGGAITEEYAKKVGADGYAPTAPEAVELAAQLLRT